MKLKIFASFLILIFSLNPAFAIDKNLLNLEFFNNFNDENLVTYVNKAYENNHKLKQATQRVEQYRQQVKYSFGKELPNFGVSANYLGFHIPQFDNFSLAKNSFILPFSMNYEADLFLKNRDKTKSAKKSYEASKFEEQAVYLSLLSDVATVYTNILEYDDLINKQTQLINIYKDILNNDTKKFQRGIITTTELNNSKNNLKEVEIKLENLQKQQEELLMQLAILIGENPNNASTLTRGNISSFEYNKEIPNEITSDVIFSRPDVKKAECLLEKAKIDVRVARKEFLPSFNITGLWAFNTIAPGTFFSWESSLATLLVGASQDIFMGGRKVANLKIQKSKYQELFENYRQVDLEAVKEVNTSLCFIKHDKEVDKTTEQKLNLENKNFNNSKMMIKNGIITKNEYLKEEAKLIQKEIEKTNTKTQRIINYYTLYKATGGKI